MTDEKTPTLTTRDATLAVAAVGIAILTPIAVTAALAARVLWLLL